ncbi:MAG: hypothetical protein SFW62_07460 [Alphaproteobacteria bacterium]|nr:hypothetical protein [Alphaproteobacteria bacterium]
MRSAKALFLLLTLMLPGCAASETHSYITPPTPGGRLCASQCQEAKDYCSETCHIQQRQCVTRVQGQALMDYQKYTAGQYFQRQAIELRPRDFERMTPCNDALKTCSDKCEDHYRACFESCGGQVKTESSCQFMCF